MTSPAIRIELATPCAANWDDMTGTERKRLCALCNKHVYELSGLTTPEIVDLVHDAEGQLCVTFFEREDGTVLTADCPLGLAQRARRLGKRAWLGVAAALASVLGVLGFGRLDGGTCDVQSPPAATRVNGPPPVVARAPVIPPITRTPPNLIETLRQRRAGGIQVIKGVPDSRK